MQPLLSDVSFSCKTSAELYFLLEAAKWIAKMISLSGANGISQARRTSERPKEKEGSTQHLHGHKRTGTRKNQVNGRTKITAY